MANLLPVMAKEREIQTRRGPARGCLRRRPLAYEPRVTSVAVNWHNSIENILAIDATVAGKTSPAADALVIKRSR